MWRWSCAPRLAAAAPSSPAAVTDRKRFFVLKRHFSEKERTFFTKIDFKTHVALVVCAEVGGRSTIVAGGRYRSEALLRAEAPFLREGAHVLHKDRLQDPCGAGRVRRGWRPQHHRRRRPLQIGSASSC